MHPSRFTRRLLAITFLGLAVRVGYVLIARRHSPPWGDAFYYHAQADLLASGHAFVDPLRAVWAGIWLPSAEHPPLYTTYLSAFASLGLRSVLQQRLASCLLGAATVAVLGLLGRRLGGERAGLLAAGLAAVYPQLWLNDGQLLSESITALVIALLMVGVERYRRSPTLVTAALIGGATALAALARGELILLFPLIAIPVVVLWSDGRRARLVRLGASTAALLIVLGPWVGWNLSRFHHPELVSSGFGTALYAGTCDPAFSGSLIGYWGGVGCSLPQITIPAPSAATLARWERDPQGTEAERTAYFRRYLEQDRLPNGSLRDESDLDIASRHAAVNYVKSHERRALLVVAAREGRIWNVFKPTQGVHLDATVDGRGNAGAWLAFVAFWPYTIAAVAGLVVLHRRGHAIWPYLMLAVEVGLAVAITYGIQRFRIPVETIVPALGAIAVDAWWTKSSLRRTPA